MSSSRLVTAAWRRKQQSRFHCYFGDEAALCLAGQCRGFFRAEEVYGDQRQERAVWWSPVS